MDIKKYKKELDEEAVFEMIIEEGDGWLAYVNCGAREKYSNSLEKSITYVAHDEGKMCGYIRALDDYGFYIYVCDLLVSESFRGQGIGRLLMERIELDYPNQSIFVMSDEDGYYEKLNFERIGSIFAVGERKD